MDLTPTREDVILLGMDAYERCCQAALAEATAALEQAPEALARCRADLETQFSAAVLSTLKVLQCPTP